MTLSLAELKKIPEIYQLTTFGYIRDTQKKLDISHIPPIISYLCLAYYYPSFDCFDKCDFESIKISDDKMSVNAFDYALNNNVFCREWINPEMKQVVTWKLKIDCLVINDPMAMISSMAQKINLDFKSL